MKALKNIRTGISPVLVLAFAAIALLSLGGVAQAAKKAKKNSVVTKSIKNGAVKASKIADGAVTTAKLADGAVTGPKIANGAIGAAALTPLEASRVVGAAGQPAFENNWVTKAGTFLKGGFYKDALGIVHLEGGIENPAASNTVAFTLPAGYRPANTIISGAAAGATGGLGGVPVNTTIAADGTVKPACLPSPFNTDCQVFLDGITFRAAG